MWQPLCEHHKIISHVHYNDVLRAYVGVLLFRSENQLPKALDLSTQALDILALSGPRLCLQCRLSKQVDTSIQL